MRLKYFLIISFFPALCFTQVVKDFKQASNGMKITLTEGTLDVSPLTGNAVRIRFYKDEKIKIPELVFPSEVSTPGFKVSDSSSRLVIQSEESLYLLISKPGIYLSQIIKEKFA